MTKGNRNAAAIALIAELAEAFPQTFFVDRVRRRPLKIGIRNDILAARPGLEPRDLGLALKIYVSCFGYQRQLANGTDRVDLNGEIAGKPTPGQIKGGANCVKHFNDKRMAAAKARREQAAAIKAKASAPPPARRIGLADLRAAAAARKAVA